MDGFRIEKLIFESLPGVCVSALVYVPEDGNEKHPAILVPAGHAENGKVHYQALCQRLVQRPVARSTSMRSRPPVVVLPCSVAAGPL